MSIQQMLDALEPGTGYPNEEVWPQPEHSQFSGHDLQFPASTPGTFCVLCGDYLLHLLWAWVPAHPSLWKLRGPSRQSSSHLLDATYISPHTPFVHLSGLIDTRCGQDFCHSCNLASTNIKEVIDTSVGWIELNFIEFWVCLLYCGYLSYSYYLHNC